MIIIVAAVGILLLIATVAFLLMGRINKPGGGPTPRKRAKSQELLLKQANKRLEQNPRDPEALTVVGEIYFQEQNWEAVFKTYEILVEVSLSNKDLNEFDIQFRYGISALQLEKFEEAYKALLLARSLQPTHFDVNYNLGVLEFQRKSYEKAAYVLIQACKQNPEHPQALRYLGDSFVNLGKYKEALPLIRKAIEFAPTDKECMYTLATCYSELGRIDQALGIFMHLRLDPVLGVNACLQAGLIHIAQHQTVNAIQDLEIGLKYEKTAPSEVLIELRYHLATVYLEQNEIGKALALLELIRRENPGYKDVVALIDRYQELNANKNYQVFMLAPSADFIALCRKIVLSYYVQGKVKILNISNTRSEWVDIITEVETAKWSDTIMFRFIRTLGSVGELVVRDFHARIKEVKAGKGICLSCGKFSEEARRYTEARIIDLIEKDRLMQILNTVDTRINSSAAKAHK
ncbi:MAG: tetratricopeptide repeat protein, partial [Spirochaetaceae bacterium]|jgi:tetratricopeptide (TPR) repeat protein|nr:tetratricopeptide repeat protein [Spirochaetaceae bacterium]